ncbi:4Fe-4S binding protein [Raineyella sp. LH-20]|uniref:4Fe-4S binding protein n=1 Tax=Raineyella sp. LH-20 TaxID=3081204 RepID=UPI002952A0EE|nr:4Fe-4S binding protein [Raineyella sp. LH-20]WOP19016.1 4Fe-4S binding protein [Raineyella sp. LH-20]
MTGPHRSIRLIEDRCTSCMICVRECPVWCITVQAHTEPDAGSEGSRRPRLHNVLDRFAIDWSVCMYCGICVDECPFDALAWSDDRVTPAGSAGGLVHERDRLAPAPGPVSGPA